MIFSFTNIEFLFYVTPGTKNFFMRFSISTNFLDRDLSTWKDEPGYRSVITKLEKTVFVNGVAEGGVKLAQNYNDILTIDIVVNRTKYTTATKSTLMTK